MLELRRANVISIAAHRLCRYPALENVKTTKLFRASRGAVAAENWRRHQRAEKFGDAIRVLREAAHDAHRSSSSYMRAVCNVICKFAPRRHLQMAIIHH
jgi:hypothetical protein